ncbi:hypothetical protein ACHAPT_009514 [Fusarium lateritium]
MPNKSKGGYKPRTQGAMPTRFRCKVGGEWKPLSDFSNNQQKLVQSQIDRRQNVDAAHCGMTCKEHSAGTKLEFRCEVCGIIKPKDHFSKAALRREEIICERCTAWTETQEPSVTPTPLETGHVSVEEESAETWTRDFANADFFNDGDLPQAPVTSLEGLGLNELGPTVGPERFSQLLSEVLTIDGSTSGHSLASVESSSVADEGMSTTGRLPPHLADKVSTKANSVANSSISTANLKQHTSLPPHLRGPGSISTASTVRKDREETQRSRQVTYNAWDSTGKQHQAVKNPTATNSSATSSMSCSDKNEYDNPNLVGDWNMVPPVEEPEPETRGPKSKWPKASEIRIPQAELKKQPKLISTKAKGVNPKIAHERRMNYSMDSSQRIAALVAWATSHGAYLNPSVQVENLPETGLSFRATSKTNPFDTIVSIPSTLTLSYLNALPGHDDPRPFPAGFLAQTPPHVIGRLLLIKHHLLGDESFWAPYLRALPQPEDEDSWSLPAFWPDDDVELFDGTNIEISVARIKANVKREFKAALEILVAEDWEPELRRGFTPVLYQWAYSIFSSRSFRPGSVLGPEDQMRLPDGVTLNDFSVLMPLFDVGNHDMTVPVLWEFDEEKKDCSLKVDKAYEAGEQVFNNYSIKTNTELLLGYGFMLSESKELHNDYVHVRRRDATPGATANDHYISLRPIRHHSSLLAQAKQGIRLSESTTLLGSFQHVQHDMVWDIFCAITTPEQRAVYVPVDSTLEGEAAQQAQLERFFSGDVTDEGRASLQQTVAIIQHKAVQELERLRETDVEIAGGGELTRNQKLALDYRDRCRRVLENTMMDMMADDALFEDEEE